MGPTSRVAVVLVALCIAACAAPPFRYFTHAPPRVFVSHQPILPASTDSIAFRAAAEVAPGRSIREVLVEATTFIAGVDTEFATTCATTPCTLSVPAMGGNGSVIYSARVTDDAGNRASSAGVYFAQIGMSTSQNIPLRVPIDLYEGRRSFRILLVRDDASANYPTQISALADIESLIYDGLLGDSIYRWRDNQLGFYLSTSGGTTSSYDSGMVTRCGQDPWVAKPVVERTRAEAGLESMDVVVVLHRQNGPEWRDCAGVSGSATPMPGFGADLRAASAHGEEPETFAHEVGHALLGLSDEYTESTASRTADAGPVSTVPCSCCDTTLGIPCLPFERTCDEPPPPECLSAPASCPPIGANCYGNGNVFESASACNTAKIAIDAHPGVETDAVPLTCRLLCAAGACPCEPFGSTREVWILDTQNPAVPASGANDDVMGIVFPASAPAERHGPACSWCAETRFCLVWETGRGRTTTEAEMACLIP